MAALTRVVASKAVGRSLIEASGALTDAIGTEQERVVLQHTAGCARGSTARAFAARLLALTALGCGGVGVKGGGAGVNTHAFDGKAADSGAAGKALVSDIVVDGSGATAVADKAVRGGFLARLARNVAEAAVVAILEVTHGARADTIALQVKAIADLDTSEALQHRESAGEVARSASTSLAGAGEAQVVALEAHIHVGVGGGESASRAVVDTRALQEESAIVAAVAVGGRAADAAEAIVVACSALESVGIEANRALGQALALQEVGQGRGAGEAVRRARAPARLARSMALLAHISVLVEPVRALLQALLVEEVREVAA